MLVLSRSNGEKIIISDRNGQVIATVELVKVDRGKVQLGFTADPSIAVHREEIYRAIYGDK